MAGKITAEWRKEQTKPKEEQNLVNVLVRVRAVLRCHMATFADTYIASGAISINCACHLAAYSGACLGGSTSPLP